MVIHEGAQSISEEDKTEHSIIKQQTNFCIYNIDNEPDKDMHTVYHEMHDVRIRKRW